MLSKMQYGVWRKAVRKLKRSKLNWVRAISKPLSFQRKSKRGRDKKQKKGLRVKEINQLKNLKKMSISNDEVASTLKQQYINPLLSQLEYKIIKVMLRRRQNLYNFLVSSHLLNNFSTESTRIVSKFPINSYLKENLIKSRIFQLKPFQEQMFYQSNNGNDCFINSCTGSGKTLAYLLPVLHQLFEKSIPKKAEENVQEAKPFQHGALILTLNKQLCLQIYKTIRILDPLQYLSVKRTGPISHYIPIVNLLSADPKTSKDQSLIDAKISGNITNTIKWSKTDVLISTPQMLYNVLDMNQRQKEIQWICPQYIVIDEADLLLEIDKNVSRHTYKIINAIQENVRVLSRSENKTKQCRFLISTSSFPLKMGGMQYQESLKKRFPLIQQIKGEKRHQIPQQIDLFFIDLQKTEQKKLQYLQKILQSRQDQRIILFCNNKKTIQDLSSFCKQTLKMTFGTYHASMDSNQRSRILHKFDKKQFSLLISTDLGARGLDFDSPVNLIIEYEMAQNVTGFLNRVGRTGRNGIKGQVITFLEPKNKQLFMHIQALVQQNDQLDQVFSRKRSYRKLYKD